MSEILAPSPRLPGEPANADARLAQIIETAEDIQIDGYRLSDDDKAKVVSSLRESAVDVWALYGEGIRASNRAVANAAVENSLNRLRQICIEMAVKMTRGELPLRDGPSTLDIIANVVAADLQRHRTDAVTAQTQRDAQNG